MLGFGLGTVTFETYLKFDNKKNVCSSKFKTSNMLMLKYKSIIIIDYCKAYAGFDRVSSQFAEGALLGRSRFGQLIGGRVAELHRVRRIQPKKHINT